MKPKLRQVSDLNTEIEAFIDNNRAEVLNRYNQLLPEINTAHGQGILSIHNRRFGSKGLFFGGAIQYLYRKNQGQPITMETTPESTEHPLTTSTHDAAIKASTPEQATTQANHPKADDNDASDFIARHAN